MNLTGLMQVLSKHVGTEVTLGPKRGAKAARDRAPLPTEDLPIKVTLEIHSVDSPGRPHSQNVYNASTDAMEEEVWTVHIARCGLRFDVFKASEEYAVQFASHMRTKMATQSFLNDLASVDFALLDTGNLVKINYQAGESMFLDFTVSFADTVKGDQQGGFIETVEVSGEIEGMVP